MKALRRTLIKGVLAAGALAALPAHADNLQHRVDVVKIMAFSCPVCRAAETQDRVIEQAVKNAGGQFVWAPLPSVASESGAKERVYYASRKVSREFSEKVKQSFYRGTQDVNIPLGEMPQVFVWAQQEMSDLSDKQFASLFEDAKGKEAHRSLSRAAQLAASVGAESLPTYIVVLDGRPVASLDPNSVSGSSLTALRDEVISRVNKLSK